MHCAACSSSLKKFMSRQEGVQSVSVNLTTEKMDVVYDDRLDADKICELVSRLSFGAQRSISLPMRSRRSGAKGRTRSSSRNSTALKSASYCA